MSLTLGIILFAFGIVTILISYKNDPTKKLIRQKEFWIMWLGIATAISGSWKSCVDEKATNASQNKLIDTVSSLQTQTNHTIDSLQTQTNYTIDSLQKKAADSISDLKSTSYKIRDSLTGVIIVQSNTINKLGTRNKDTIIASIVESNKQITKNSVDALKQATNLLTNYMDEIQEVNNRGDLSAYSDFGIKYNRYDGKQHFGISVSSGQGDIFHVWMRYYIVSPLELNYSGKYASYSFLTDSFESRGELSGPTNIHKGDSPEFIFDDFIAAKGNGDSAIIILYGDYSRTKSSKDTLHYFFAFYIDTHVQHFAGPLYNLSESSFFTTFKRF